MELIEWVSKEQAVALQEELKSQLVLENKGLCEYSTVAGVDLAYWNQEGEEYAVCCIVVLDRKTKEVVESKHYKGKITIPYIPGCLAFRELPLVLETVKSLETEPELYMFDGNGYLHPRHMGIASHASFYLNKPTIGVAKSYYKVGDTDYTMPENREGAYSDIVINHEVYGRVLRTHEDVKPVFVSAGNYIDLETATNLVMDFTGREGHIPLPTRLADIETHRMRKAYCS